MKDLSDLALVAIIKQHGITLSLGIGSAGRKRLTEEIDAARNELSRRGQILTTAGDRIAADRNSKLLAAAQHYQKEIMKITGDTTLGGLALRAAQLGVDDLRVWPLGVDAGYRVVVMGALNAFGYGKGMTLPEAIDDAFQKLATQIGASL